MTLSTDWIIQHQKTGRWANNSEGRARKRLWTSLRYSSGMQLQWLMKAMGNLNTTITWNEILNRTLQDWRPLPIQSWRFVIYHEECSLKKRMETVISTIRRSISGRTRAKLLGVWVVKKWKQNTSSHSYNAYVYWQYSESKCVLKTKPKNLLMFSQQCRKTYSKNVDCKNLHHFGNKDAFESIAYICHLTTQNQKRISYYTSSVKYTYIRKKFIFKFLH